MNLVCRRNSSVCSPQPFCMFQSQVFFFHLKHGRMQRINHVLATVAELGMTTATGGRDSHAVRGKVKKEATTVPLESAGRMSSIKCMITEEHRQLQPHDSFRAEALGSSGRSGFSQEHKHHRATAVGSSGRHDQSRQHDGQMEVRCVLEFVGARTRVLAKG